ncbi:MAG: NAD(P)H-hydrate dehydratase, partial [Burkholderiales bacterium]
GDCFAADATITFIADKPGLHTGDGPDCAGRVTVEPLGLDRSGWPAPDGALAGRNRVAAALRRLCRPMNSHKGSFGTLAVLGGDTGTVGAVLLAARAALCLGAGRVQVGFVSGPPLAYDPSAPELMLRAADGALAMRPEAIAVGPGLGQRPPGRAALQASLASPGQLVIDADALNQLAAEPSLRQALAQRGMPAVLTPHPLEAARLLGCGAADVQSDRIDAACRLASADRAIVVLKGAGSVIAAPDGRWWINASGGPALATAGTGDVLTGMIGALLAQGMAPLEASLAAVWLHGAAADRWTAQQGGSTGMAATELIAPARALANELIAQTD